MLKLTGYTSMAAFLAACGNGTGTTGTTTTGGSLSIGNNTSDPGPKEGHGAGRRRLQVANGGTNVKLNTVDHGCTFQGPDQLYLQATPDDVFTCSVATACASRRPGPGDLAQTNWTR